RAGGSCEETNSQLGFTTETQRTQRIFLKKYLHALCASVVKFNSVLETLSRKLRHRLSLPLPGREAQLRMAHSERRENMLRYKIPDGARKGAVLILFFEEENKIKLPLILRSEYKGVHSGQVALPGG